MTRDTAFWTLVIVLIFIPGLVFGWFRGRTIGRTYRAICEDLKKNGIELSKVELHLMMQQLNRNPRAIIAADSSAVSKAVKERHVESLFAYLKPFRICFHILAGVGVLAVISFQHLWPNK